jgi:molybdate transport system substrate-binding protein
VVVPTGSNLVVSLESGAGFAAAVGDGRVAMGDPAHVPAGRYAKAALQSLGAWSALKPKTALAGNVRAALALVERGEAVAGLVYATDAAISDKVRVAAVFPPRSQGRIAYPLALLAGVRDRAATGLYRFFRGPEARAIFRKHGFTPLEAHD